MVNRIVTFSFHRGGMMNASKLFVVWSCAAISMAAPAMARAQERGSVIDHGFVPAVGRVETTRTEAPRLATLLPPAAPEQSQIVGIVAEPMRRRVSISAMFGSDNEFSGKMIQE